MAARVASTTPTVPPEQEPDHAGAVGQLKHCWVADEHGRLPGLLLEWRRTGLGFRGRVIHPVQDGVGGWVVVEEWLPAERLGPVEPKRH